MPPGQPTPRSAPLVIQTEDLDATCAAWLGERCRLERAYHEEARFNELLPDAEALVVRTYTRVNDEMLDRAPNLRVVGRAGVALENVDVPACLRRGVQVVHTPGSNTRAVVEYLLALLVDELRPREYLTGAPSPTDWHEIRRNIARHELNELTLGILGMGRIGSSVARVAEALEMRVLYHDIVDIPADRRWGAEAVGLDELVSASDILSIHVDYRSSNRGLIDARACSLLKPDALVVNTSRGFVIDAHALADHLRAHPGARALVDVHDPFEPVPADYPLLGIPNAVVSPHLASGTTKAKRDMSWVVRDVWGVLQGEDPVNPPPAWLMAEAQAAIAADA